MGEPAPDETPYWSRTSSDVLAGLSTSENGLTESAARQRLAEIGLNRLTETAHGAPFRKFLAQFKSPLAIILLIAAAISAGTGELIDAGIVLTIVVASAVMGFVQEFRAGNAVEKLRHRITLKTTVVREGNSVSLPAEQIVPGDLVLLSAGNLVPADGLVLAADDFFVNQAVLTGESYPAEKTPATVASGAPLPDRTNCVFMGTNVRSGSAKVLITATGARTEFGQVAGRLALAPKETEFERGVRHFGAMLTQVMGVLVFVVFAANVLLNKPPLDSLLFAVALAVGMTPELLPAIISITLAQGAQEMARRGVIVRRLNAIENLGSMDVLCTDKTGTLTLGIVRLDAALDPTGAPSLEVGRWAYLNAHFQTGLANPLDEAILAGEKSDLTGVVKTEEIPYDFTRKRLTVAIREGSDTQDRLLTKGALDNILSACATVRASDGQEVPLDATRLDAIQQLFVNWSEQGFRVLGIATRRIDPLPEYTPQDEAGMVFEGFLHFFDPPKTDARQTIVDLKTLGVSLKIITGDNRRVAMHVAESVGLEIANILTGTDLSRMQDEALWHAAERTTLFAEVDPNQKERIISALRKTGHVVGYMGDGINDAPALHAADVGISVDTAADVARETADFVLLERGLDVLHRGIEEGRTTFANTLKYVFTTTSANFGNMISMAGLSVFLPFLPLLPKQILLNNFLSDFPAMTISSDTVDREWVDRPRRWDVGYIRSFMIVFGLVSSAFDFVTFSVLLFVVRASQGQFQTAWFLESLYTELVILLVVRTRRPFFKSTPGKALWVSTLFVAVGSMAMVYLPPVQRTFGFVPLPLPWLTMLLAITALYVAANEFVKPLFYSHALRRAGRGAG